MLWVSSCNAMHAKCHFAWLVQGRTPLHSAAKHNALDMLIKLLQYQPDLNAQDSEVTMN
jgi:ankyrin repeat protein